jgi:hypothetical protein
MGITVLDQLQSISRDLDNAITDLSRLEQEAAMAESAYRVAKAQAFMKAAGAVQAREYQAIIDTEIQLINRDKTAALVRIQREHIRALHARIDVGRTIVATERTLSGVSI